MLHVGVSMVSELPMVNVLVFSYNQEDLIEQSVMSCINQSYQNLMVVVTDDGSVDSTPSILMELQDKFPDRLKVILNETNQGITKNCNVGLSHCEHELIAFAAGDDVLYEDKIAKQVEAFLGRPGLVFCYHPVHIVMDNKIVAVSGNKRKDQVSNFYEMIAKYGAAISGSVVMVRRSAIPQGGFNENIPVASDWLFFIEVSSKGEVLRIDDVLSKYRKHEGNIGHKIFQYADDFLLTMDYVEAKYRHDKLVPDACAAGRSRFLLGIIYNSLISGNKLGFAKYSGIYREGGGRFAGFICLLHKVPGIHVVLKNFRSVIKSVV